MTIGSGIDILLFFGDVAKYWAKVPALSQKQGGGTMTIGSGIIFSFCSIRLFHF
jgi:hypothetical protein